MKIETIRSQIENSVIETIVVDEAIVRDFNGMMPLQYSRLDFLKLMRGNGESGVYLERWDTYPTGAAIRPTIVGVGVYGYKITLNKHTFGLTLNEFTAGVGHTVQPTALLDELAPGGWTTWGGILFFTESVDAQRVRNHFNTASNAF
jgi:hypothetical protein